MNWWCMQSSMNKNANMFTSPAKNVASRGDSKTCWGYCQLRFIHTEDQCVILRLRRLLQLQQWSVAWMALVHSCAAVDIMFLAGLQHPDDYVPKAKAKHLKRSELKAVLSTLLAQDLCGYVTEYCSRRCRKNPDKTLYGFTACATQRAVKSWSSV